MVSTLTLSLVSHRKYMPPEFRKEGNISPKNDVFSLGVVMIEIMTGRPAGYSNTLETGDIAHLMQKVIKNIFSLALEFIYQTTTS